MKNPKKKGAIPPAEKPVWREVLVPINVGRVEVSGGNDLDSVTRAVNTLRNIFASWKARAEEAVKEFAADVVTDGMHCLDWADERITYMARGEMAAKYDPILAMYGNGQRSAEETLAWMILHSRETAIELASRYPCTSSHVARVTALARIDAAGRIASDIQELTCQRWTAYRALL